jgi:3-phenylpropionate/trans-cinnamate dioxygenase ferredoxin component
LLAKGGDRKQGATMTDKHFVPVAQLDEIPAGSKKLIDAHGLEILLCHTAGKVFAVKNQCSHAYEKLDCGRMRGGWISCPVHGARFDLETGAAMNPPAMLPIETYEVRVIDGIIEVAV